MSESRSYRILLYYKFTRIDDPEAFAAAHLEFCKSLGVLGRILIAAEGINGTISGTADQTERYISLMRLDERFSDMEFKMDEVPSHVFKRLSVKARKEIVTLGLDGIDPRNATGSYLEPAEFYTALQEKDAILLDVRNDYEYEMGHFRGALRPPVRTFKEFPQWIRENLSDKKDRKILTYCTGGIRCEKFTSFLLSEGFDSVYQLHGGIINYSKNPDVRGRLFDGKCYMFDERISVSVNHTGEETIISQCHYCGAATDRFVNCAHLDCHVRFFVCEPCEKVHRRSCSQTCEEAKHHEYVEN
jgi:UPF0176 protein